MAIFFINVLMTLKYPDDISKKDFKLSEGKQRSGFK